MLVECRPARESDINAIQKLEELCFDIPWSRQSIENEISFNRCARFFVAEANGEVIAYIGSALVCGESEIYNVATHPDFRRQGAAKALLQFFLDAVSAEGAEAFSLDVRPRNAAAIGLYIQFGFKEEGRRKAYYSNGEDAIIMWRRKQE